MWTPELLTPPPKPTLGPWPFAQAFPWQAGVSANLLTAVGEEGTYVTQQDWQG